MNNFYFKYFLTVTALIMICHCEKNEEVENIQKNAQIYHESDMTLHIIYSRTALAEYHPHV